MNNRDSRAAGRIALLYAVFAGLWIVLSDRLLGALVDAPDGLTLWSTYKGFAFVAITALLLFVLLRAELAARARADERLREHEARYQELFAANPQPMWVYDVTTLRFLAVNDAALAQYGYSREQFLAMSALDIRPPDEAQRLREHVAEVAVSGFRAAGLWRHRKRDGTVFDVEVSSHTIDFGGRRARVVLAQDVTARLRAERELARRNRLYDMLSESNQLVVRAADAQSILDGICRIAVEHGGFRFAWVGLIGADGAVTPAARAGDDRGYIDELRLSLDADGATLGGPTVRALRGGAHVVSNDFLADPSTRPWHDAARRAGICASAAFPLRRDGAVIGSLNLYAAESGFFGDAELSTLDEMAIDISFGLDVVQRNLLLQAASQVVEASPVVLFRWRPEPGWPVEYVSNNVARWGYRAEDFLSGVRPFVSIVEPEDLPRVGEEVERYTREGRREYLQVYRIRTAAGELRWVEDATTVERAADGRVLRYQGTMTDISERRAAEAAIRESERFARAALDSLVAHIAIVDADGTIVAVNQAWRDFAADNPPLRAAVCEGANYLAACSPAEPAARAFADGVREVMAGRRAEISVEYACHAPHEQRWFIARVTPFIGGAAGRVVIAHENVTARKQAELALAASEQRFRATFEQAAVGMAHMTLDGRWLEVNGRLCEILGYSRDELLGRSFADITHPQDLPPDRETLQRSVSGAVPNYSLEKRYLRKDGSIVWTNVTVAVVRDSGGAPEYLVTVTEDITARKRADDELRKLYEAVEQTSESVVITDVDGAIEYVNDSFVLISGYRREELIGRNPRVLQSGRTSRATYEAMWRALRAGRPWTGEFVNRRKDGREYVESAVISPVRGADGQVAHYVAVKEDVTEKRQLADELERYRQRLEELVAERTQQLEQARRQAEAANEAKSAFLANMSHEIRTPMNGVLGLLEVLARTPLTDEQAEMLRLAGDSGRTLLGVIDDILDFSKIESGRLQIESTPMSVLEVVEGLCDSLVPVAERRDVDLGVFVAPRLPRTVRSDPLRLRQILFNLLGNAIKFSGGRSDVRGRVSLQVTAAVDTPSALSFTVSDNGIGMPPEVVERLFTPFTQGEASTTRRFGGSGLGLTICKRLVDLMGGRIEVRSAVGAGSCFTVELPIEVVEEAPPPSPVDLAGVRCLLVESPELDSEALAAYLEFAGAQVERIGDPGQAAGAAGPGPTVVLRHGGAASAVPPDGGAGTVLITHGRRRRPRLAADRLITLDGNGLRRATLLQAVAAAAGRAQADALQKAAAEPAPTAVPALQEASDRGEAILVAEDDEISQQVICRQLALLGRTAEVAADGVAALRMWREGRYALLLTDLHMPRMDGYALAQAIRNEESAGAALQGRAARTPIIVLTANALRGEAERARALGIDEYLTKPVRLDVLRQALERWLPAQVRGERQRGIGAEKTAAP